MKEVFSNFDGVTGPLEDLVSERRVPGLAIQVNYGGSKVFQWGFGFSDLENRQGVDPERTLFRIASISKPITATALALLVDDRTVELDADLREYVPEFPGKHGRVSLRQLAAHTAGIRAYRGKEFALNRPYSIAEGLSLFISDPLVFPPGQGYLYNSFDFVLLSLAMERAAGIPFPDIVQERVLDPLGMTQTYMEIPGEPWPGQAVFYTRAGGTFRLAVPVDTRYKLAGGGYLSTVSDICRLGQSYLGGNAIPEQLEKDFLTAAKVKGASTCYGLGWEVSHDPEGRRFFGHTGNAVGAYTNFKIFPDTGMVVSILINASVPEVQPVLDEVTGVLLDSAGSPA